MRNKSDANWEKVGWLLMAMLLVMVVMSQECVGNLRTPTAVIILLVVAILCSYLVGTE